MNKKLCKGKTQEVFAFLLDNRGEIAKASLLFDIPPSVVQELSDKLFGVGSAGKLCSDRAIVIEKLFRGGDSYSLIASMLDTTINIVQLYVKKFEIDKQERMIPVAARDRRIIMELMKNVPLEEIANYERVPLELLKLRVKSYSFKKRMKEFTYKEREKPKVVEQKATLSDVLNNYSYIMDIMAEFKFDKFHRITGLDNMTYEKYGNRIKPYFHSEKVSNFFANLILNIKNEGEIKILTEEVDKASISVKYYFNSLNGLLFNYDMNGKYFIFKLTDNIKKLLEAIKNDSGN